MFQLRFLSAFTSNRQLIGVGLENFIVTFSNSRLEFFLMFGFGKAFLHVN